MTRRPNLRVEALGPAICRTGKGQDENKGAHLLSDPD